MAGVEADSEGNTTLDISTVDTEDDNSLSNILLPAATLLYHPDARRLGERATLHELHTGFPAAISRAYPPFSSVGNTAAQPTRHGHPLDDPHVSRTPLWIRREGEDLVFWAEHGGIRATVEGQALAGPLRVPQSRLSEGGIVVSLGGYVVLWLHLATGTPAPVNWHGLMGVSPAMVMLRERIARLASTPYPVMLRGESGAGKELVARAMHQAGPRAQGPYVTLNMAAVPSSVAAAELFGYERGAFTGANQARKGRFEQADGGTLFLDEIGEAPPEVQTQLLRALDSGEIQPLGGQTRRVDVRVVSATDADLESRVSEHRFSKALLYRLHSGLLEVPPLRDRRMDVPILLHHFLREGLRSTGAPDRLALQPPPERPWLSARLIDALLAWSFPGNVRELKNIANEIVLHSSDRKAAELSPELVTRLARIPEPSSPSPAPRPAQKELTGPLESPSSTRELQRDPREPRALTAARVQEALAHNGWRLARAAAALGVARNTLVRFIESTPDLHRPSNLDADAILAALEQHHGNIEAAAEALQVSAHGLRLRMHALELSDHGRM